MLCCFFQGVNNKMKCLMIIQSSIQMKLRISEVCKCKQVMGRSDVVFSVDTICSFTHPKISCLVTMMYGSVDDVQSVAVSLSLLHDLSTGTLMALMFSSDIYL